MSYYTKSDFSRGEGFSYCDVVHLLQGTKKSRSDERSSGEAPYFHDENIRGYGWGDNQELKEINKMELGIGTLSQELRDLRTMVDFCCIWRYDYPQRVHDICKAIGGKGTMLSRCHYQVGTEKRDELIAYARALKKWLGHSDYEDTPQEDKQMVEEVENRVFTMLGKREKVKDLLVERTFIGLACRNIDCSFFGSRGDGQPEQVFPSNAARLNSDWRSRMRLIEKQILNEMGGDAYDFFCEVGGAEPACHFKFIRRLEILIGSIGCLRWRGYLPPKDSKVSGRRLVTQRYLSVLHAYWSDSKLPKDEKDNDLLSLQETLFEDLGKTELHKKWLIASLWKNIKNQTEHQAFTMKHWVEFVQITRSLMNSA